MMAEYKDTDVILKEIYRRANCSSIGETTVPYLDWKEVVSIINDAPTADVVEVVRCKDCINYAYVNGYEFFGQPMRYCVRHNRLKREDGYCDDGLRKEKLEENNNER